MRKRNHLTDKTNLNDLEAFKESILSKGQEDLKLLSFTAEATDNFLRTLFHLSDNLISHYLNINNT